MDTKGGKLWGGGDGGVLNWAIGIDMYTLMCIKLMTDKKETVKASGCIIARSALNANLSMLMSLFLGRSNTI